ncbi:MAG TPA: MFS transporter [Burkholderiales bacterium]|nr:MFS transporter [Burkholderiales bacterium]
MNVRALRSSHRADLCAIESPYAWRRLLVALLLSTLGGVGMWSIIVALPALQAEFGVSRAQASLAYTATMVGFGVSGIALGRMSDRWGIMVPVLLGTGALAFGFVAAAWAGNVALFSLAQGGLIGVGSAATFAPLMADTSQWFDRRRGMAVGIFASGNYLSGALWPPILQYGIDHAGWRYTYLVVAAVSLFVMLPLAAYLRRRPPLASPLQRAAVQEMAPSPPVLGLSTNALQALLLIAGVACCVAMSMPQVHIVAYCGDLGYGAARGAQMLSLMLACGIVSRLSFGFISDRIGGLRTLLLSSSLQGFALLLFLPFDGLASLYLISALFGLFQGGIVPSYAIIIREYFPAHEAGARMSAVITATLFGMALGGWMSGAIFDLTGSYRSAFLNGIAWNALNLTIAGLLLRRATCAATRP